jgi:hypothetical protein
MEGAASIAAGDYCGIGQNGGRAPQTDAEEMSLGRDRFTWPENLAPAQPLPE